jgi:hypothetical protein
MIQINNNKFLRRKCNLVIYENKHHKNGESNLRSNCSMDFGNVKRSVMRFSCKKSCLSHRA